MMLLIVIALAVLPGLVTDVSDTLRKRKGIVKFGMYYNNCLQADF